MNGHSGCSNVLVWGWCQGVTCSTHNAKAAQLFLFTGFVVSVKLCMGGGGGGGGGAGGLVVAGCSLKCSFAFTSLDLHACMHTYQQAVVYHAHWSCCLKGSTNYHVCKNLAATGRKKMCKVTNTHLGAGAFPK